jgi:hypothetical protein
MGEMSQLPASAVRTLRAPIARNTVQRAVATLGPVVAVPPPAPATPENPPAEPRELNVIGPRKLIRPTLPEGTLRDRRLARREEPTVWHPPAPASAVAHEASHAESFYFQKQVQAQTPMVFVLEDGEKIEGCIEWYDRNAIKVRCSGSPRGNSNRASDTQAGARTLIYKSSIKYLYKAGENQP